MASLMETLQFLLCLLVGGEWVRVYGDIAFIVGRNIMWKATRAAYRQVFDLLSCFWKCVCICGFCLLWWCYFSSGAARPTEKAQEVAVSSTISSSTSVTLTQPATLISSAASISTATATATSLHTIIPTIASISNPTLASIAPELSMETCSITSNIPAAVAIETCVPKVGEEWSFQHERNALDALRAEAAGIHHPPLTNATTAFVDGAQAMLNTSENLREEFNMVRDSFVPAFIQLARMGTEAPSSAYIRDMWGVINTKFEQMDEEEARCEEQYAGVMVRARIGSKAYMDKAIAAAITELKREAEQRKQKGVKASKKKAPWPRMLKDEQIVMARKKLDLAVRLSGALAKSQALDGCLGKEVSGARGDWDRCMGSSAVSGDWTLEELRKLEELRLKWPILPIGRNLTQPSLSA